MTPFLQQYYEKFEAYCKANFSKQTNMEKQLRSSSYTIQLDGIWQLKSSWSDLTLWQPPFSTMVKAAEIATNRPNYSEAVLIPVEEHDRVYLFLKKSV